MSRRKSCHRCRSKQRAPPIVVRMGLVDRLSISKDEAAFVGPLKEGAY